jgi:isoleucyl-tRNA synthetase
MRRDKLIRSSLEAEVTLTLADADLAAAARSVPFDEVCIVSTLALEQGGEDAVAVARTDNHKCGRCWRHLPEVEEDGALCKRCEDVVNG